VTLYTMNPSGCRTFGSGLMKLLAKLICQIGSALILLVSGRGLAAPPEPEWNGSLARD
jgi:hypothetical protein